MSVRTTEMPGQSCPHCHAVQDCATAAGDAMPKPGDLVVCFECAGVSVYGEDLRPRIPDPMEMLRFELSESWPRVQRMRAKIANRLK